MLTSKNRRFVRRVRRFPKPVRRYLWRYRGDLPQPRQRPSWWLIVFSWLGALTALSVLGFLSEQTDTPLIMASFGASTVLLHANPESTLAQPRNVVLGHLIGATTGICIGFLLGDAWFAMACSVATAIGLTSCFHCVHPPAGATAIIGLAHVEDWSNFLVSPVLTGSALLVLASMLFNNLHHERRYPRRWF